MSKVDFNDLFSPIGNELCDNCKENVATYFLIDQQTGKDTDKKYCDYCSEVYWNNELEEKNENNNN